MMESRIEKTGSQIERLSNWVGFLFYLLVAVRLVVQSPQIGVWMLPSFLHELIIAVAFLSRQPLRRIAPGFLPRATAYSGTFILPLFLIWAGRCHPQWLGLSPVHWMQELGAPLWVAGSLLGLWTVWSLRRSISLVPQARSLVTSGPYRLARHPIYAGYLVQYVGLWLAHWSLALGLILLLWLALTASRVHFEESVLQAEFPQYRQYQKTVGVFAPRLRRSHAMRNVASTPSPYAAAVPTSATNSGRSGNPNCWGG
jgi:protein-S-isoprenylcysteine O-methyltransferase Ste14